MNKTKSSVSIELMNGEDFLNQLIHHCNINLDLILCIHYDLLLFIRYINFPTIFWNRFIVIYRNKNFIYKYF